MTVIATPKKGRRGRSQQREGPHPVDVHVGSRIRMRRTLLGMSQTALGDALGLTFQQVQKYERGANRVGSSRLFEISRILDVPVSFFFEEMPPETSAGASSSAPLQEDEGSPSSDDIDPLARHETSDLVRAYYAISDPRTRKRLFELTKVLAAEADRMRG